MNSLILADARAIIAAAEERAREIGQPMNIAVVDAGGILVSRDGNIVGAIRVSGGSGEEDQTVAEAGVQGLAGGGSNG